MVYKLKSFQCLVIMVQLILHVSFVNALFIQIVELIESFMKDLQAIHLTTLKKKSRKEKMQEPMDELFEGNPLSSIIEDLDYIENNIITKDEFSCSTRALKFDLLFGTLLITVGFAAALYLLVMWSL